jgi:hypothetical protein
MSWEVDQSMLQWDGIYRTCYCKLNRLDDSCARAQKAALDSGFDFSSCPKDFSPIGETKHGTIQGEPLPGHPKTFSYNSASFLFLVSEIRKNPKIDQWLYPAHVNEIIQPGCDSANALYYTCSKNANRTSKEHGGEGCLDVPSICREEGGKWLYPPVKTGAVPPVAPAPVVAPPAAD